MKKLRKILVAIADPHTVPVGALRRAAALAGATNARIELFHCVTAPHAEPRRVGNRRIDVQLTPEGSLNAAQRALEQIARSKLLQGCRVDALAAWDRRAHEAIVRRALAMHADLIINGTRCRGATRRMFLHYTDWELVRRSPVPLLLVKSERQPARAVVLAAIDPLHANSKPARLDGRILDVARSMAVVLKGTLHAFHCYLPPSIALAAGLGVPVVWDGTELDTNHSQKVEREFTRALRRTEIPIGRRHLRVGAAATELAACAQQIRATLVVMGAVSRSRLDRLFIGNTAERVLDELTCDLLIVKPHGMRTAPTEPT
jgi:universal stress protein E